MRKIAESICKNKKIITIVSCILLILSVVGMKLTKVNYDILVYLPQDIETIKGQNLLTDDFEMGSYSIAVANNLNSTEILDLEEKIRSIEGVNNVMSLYDAIGTTVPLDMLPNDLVGKVHNEDSDLLFITFAGSTSSKGTLDAVKEIREISDGKISQGGMSSMVLDTMELSEKEILIYIVIAVILCVIVLEVSLDSFVVPFILLANIGFAILFNLGTNIFFGEISYITKALVAVLQLGVTTDFSIFLYHSYEKNKKKFTDKNAAMVESIKNTFTAVTGSSLTTIAGFLVLCTMQLTLGKDLGLVMAKGVLLGVICVLTLFPSLILLFDNVIEKTKHKSVMPNFNKLNHFIVKHHVVVFVIFLLLLVPAYLANSKVDIYYKLDRSLPDTLESIKINEVLKENYNIVSPEIILVDKDLKNDDLLDMIEKLEETPGIDFVLSFAKLKDIGVTENMIGEDLVKAIENENYQIMLVNSTYDIATDELNEQIVLVNDIVKSYDKNGIIAGEGPLMRNLIDICDIDFNNVNTSSIICIFLILFVVLKSLSLPFLLIIAIEFAIFANMSISYFNGTTLPFIAPIVLGTIQLGATIDYAILLTTTYLEKRKNGLDKKKAMVDTLNYSGTSIFVSGMCFFAATFGVGIYSKIEMIGSLCALIARGAIISMLVVITVLPSILLIFDKIIIKTTKLKGDEKMKKNYRKKIAICVMSAIAVMQLCPISVLALSKNETVYSKLDYDGSVKSTLVNEQIVNSKGQKTLDDYSELKNILNIGNNSTFNQNKNDLTWYAEGKDIFYQGSINKSLPVVTSISYKLDGKEMSLDEMIGKEGKVTITLKYKNRDKHNVLINGKYESLYTPFVVTMGTIIDSKNNSNVTVSNGKVISNGTKNIVVGMSMPGLYESLKLSDLKKLDTITISYDTTKFELASIYSIITPKLVESNDLTIFKKMDSIYEQVDMLESGMNEIESGSKTLSSGSQKLKTGLLSAMNGLKENSGSALSEEQITDIKNQAVDGVKSTFTTEYKEAIANEAWMQVQESLANSSDATVENYVKNTVASILQTYLGSEDNLKYYVGCTSNNEMACMALNAAGFNVQDVLSFQNSITASVVSLAQNTSLYTAENVSKNVAVSVSSETTLKTASTVAGSVAPSVADEVKKASLDAVTNSLNVLYNGVQELDKGINSLSEGITKYNEEGISKISELVDSEVKPSVDKINALVRLGENYKTFGGAKSNQDGETKFILVADSKKVPNKVQTVKETKSHTTLWERIKNLFK